MLYCITKRKKCAYIALQYFIFFLVKFYYVKSFPQGNVTTTCKITGQRLSMSLKIVAYDLTL